MFQSIQEDITQVMELNKQIIKMEEEIKLNPHVSILHFVQTYSFSPWEFHNFLQQKFVCFFSIISVRQEVDRKPR